MSTTAKFFGKTKTGEDVFSYTLKNSHGMEIEFISYGAAIRKIMVPIKGEIRDVVLGFDDVAAYEKQTCYIGAFIGPVGNRISNGKFVIDGEEFTLTQNNFTNNLHSGEGFHTKNMLGVEDGNSISFTYVRPDGEEGFPGNLSATVIYTLTEDNELIIEYKAETDKKTPVNLTNHSYFNFNGGGTILDHEMEIFSDYVCDANAELAPSGVLVPVEDTAFDFNVPKTIGRDIEDKHQLMIFGGGYDHNYVLSDKDFNELSLAARVKNEDLIMECYTTQPGLQFYAGNFLEAENGKNGVTYAKRQGFCLETQNYPDAINVETFPNSVLAPDEKYYQKTIYKFMEIK